MTDESVLGELAGQMHTPAPRHVAVDEALGPLQPSGGPEAGRHGWQHVAYASPGPAPFTCGNCRHYRQIDEHAGYCMLVQGPYEGFVGGEDTCRLWQGSPAVLHATPGAMIGGEDQSSPEESEPEEDQTDAVDSEPPDHGSDLGAA